MSAPGPASAGPEAPQEVHSAGLLVAVSATFTAAPVQEVLSYWLGELGLTGTVSLAPYHQVFQQLLDPGGLLGSNADGLNVLLIRPEDFVRHLPEGQDPAPALERSGQELASALRA